MEEARNHSWKAHDRIQALLKGETPDRVPLYPFLLGFCARNVGYPVASIYNDARKSFDAQRWTLEQYGFDWVPMYGYASYGTWEFGGEVRMPTGGYEQAPMHESFPVQSEEDMDRMARPDVTRAGCLPLAMEFSRLQKDHGMPVTVVLGGNFTIAGCICPAELLCRWMLKKPDLAHRILRLATDHMVDVVQHWVHTFGAENVYPQIWEPLGSNDIISPKQFERFVLPYLQEIGEVILQTGVKHILYHICGEQNRNLHFWAEVPMGEPGICSIGKEIDIDTAIRVLGDQAVIAGNIDPSIIQNGAPSDVFQTCKDALARGRKAPRGFMLMPGCEIPPGSPPYNVYMMKAAIDDACGS